MGIIHLRAIMEVIGEDDFNEKVGEMAFSSDRDYWASPASPSFWDGGYVEEQRRTRRNGEVVVDGRSSLRGEFRVFDGGSETLIYGSAYYFDLPGDNSSAVQGWNAIYLGQVSDDLYEFWSSSIGTYTVRWKEGQQWVPESTEGWQVRGTYLAALESHVNTLRAKYWDLDGSAH